ncbi:hypothetical protein cyc_00146 [Cyclospora cayetanensis]|uniref:Uncharacterized protein n=1 Tax=Cyclospora cayetanensis TaxID=88456 RepID=A0A1D3D553_9EIME|nr:hypothetical protein cyc_00146 [Cyclospora cayetanensis]
MEESSKRSSGLGVHGLMTASTKLNVHTDGTSAAKRLECRSSSADSFETPPAELPKRKRKGDPQESPSLPAATQEADNPANDQRLVSANLNPAESRRASPFIPRRKKRRRRQILDPCAAILAAHLYGAYSDDEDFFSCAREALFSSEPPHPPITGTPDETTEEQARHQLGQLASPETPRQTDS